MNPSSSQHAAEAVSSFGSTLGQPNALAVLFFLGFIVITLGVTYWAARRTTSTSAFYTAGSGITAGQNGFALAGDYMSAASFLGIAGLVALSGFDGLIYSTGWLVGWPVVLFLIAEPLRNLGKFTFTDVVTLRLRQRPIRIAAAFAAMTIVILYMIPQMVGAGNLIKLLFGIHYEAAVGTVGCVMLIYVLFGGMIATTWVQIIKAVLLLGGACMMATLVLGKFGMNPVHLFAAAADKYPHTNVLAPGKLIANPLDALSLGLALMFGTAGLPHILMRFYTVPNAKAARTSVFYATGLIGFFYLLTFILGFGAMVLVGQDTIRAIDKGGNMAAPLLAEVLGGTPFLGFIAAVAFATILAVVAGLTLSGSAAISHDLWTHVIRRTTTHEREQLFVARLSSIALAVISVMLGIIFKGQNVAFMVGLAFALAASTTFPVLVLSIFWRLYTTHGAVASIVVGLGTTIALIWLSPTIQVDILQHSADTVLFPLKNPGLVSIPLSFIVGIIVSLLRPEASAQEQYTALSERLHLGSLLDHQTSIH
ncbi:MAG: sodium/solute symporter [Bacteroidota bacterium]|nr:sodium/solute symporter [Candidatus Kapabacteria bacterium]MDW8220774.1 sodium/solute symporter [Bacteroidota bacterium]